MHNNLLQTNTDIYKKCGLTMSNFKWHPESKEYAACEFELNGLNIICRNAKLTP